SSRVRQDSLYMLKALGMNQKIYLDYNATTPVHPEVLPYVQEVLKKGGNPSSVHWAGREAKKVVGNARDLIARFLNCDPLEVIFTSGGSEANNLCLKNITSLLPKRDEIIVSGVEHPSILRTVEFLAKKGFKIHFLNVNRAGCIDL